MTKPVSITHARPVPSSNHCFKRMSICPGQIIARPELFGLTTMGGSSIQLLIKKGHFYMGGLQLYFYPLYYKNHGTAYDDLMSEWEILI